MSGRLNLCARAMPRFIALIFSAFLCLAVMPAAAQQADPYSVSEVPVDVTAGSALQAREKAFADVQRLAFRRLMDRLVAEGQPRVPEPPAREIEAMVRDVIVESEKASAVRYIASFTVRFKPEAIRSLLEGSGLSYVDTRRPPLVVVPVLVAGDGPVLWDDPNPWREAWARRPSDGLVPFIVPTGELADVTLVSAKQAVAHDVAALTALARRHGAHDVLVAVATVAGGPDTLPSLSVATVGFGPAAPQGESLRLAAKPDDTLPMLMDRAVETIAQHVVSGHKQLAAIPPGQEAAGPINALVPLSGGMQEWLALRGRLAAVPLVKRVEVVSLTRDEAAVVLHVAGAMPQVEQVLHQAGFTLTPGDGVWYLGSSMGGAPR